MGSTSSVFDYKPRVLLLTAYRWPTTTRLALALIEAGTEVDVLCPRAHWLERLKFISRKYRYNALNGVASCRSAIQLSNPDIVIPTDDRTAAELHELYQRSNSKNSADARLRVLIARSMGDPGLYPTFYARDKISALARANGLPSPVVTAINNHVQLLDALEVIGYPAVLKTDGSSGGVGVAIAKNQADAELSFSRLAHHSVARAAKRLFVDSDPTLLWPTLFYTRPRVTIQPFIRGRRANAAVACWEGEVLTYVTVEVLASNGLTGPATVVRAIANSGISDAVDRLVGLLRLSGLCGFDFILDERENKAHLIDFNPRATQTCHLMSFEGDQPVAHLAAKLTGSKLTKSIHQPNLEPIVLFPHGFLIDPRSAFAQYADTDLPIGFAEFQKIGIDYRRRKNRLLNKAVKYLRRWSDFHVLRQKNK
jgi:hypothetical protein